MVFLRTLFAFSTNKEVMIDIHDQLYSLRDENIQLKKKMTESEDNTKKLDFILFSASANLLNNK